MLDLRSTQPQNGIIRLFSSMLKAGMTPILNIDPDQRTEQIGKPLSGWRLKVYTIIFEAETPAGRRFDC